ncbi:MAG: potassium/proton antiporter [Oscillospiraceae bacterium]|nr:potassium/proton antiporter [Oscillospiraceae bacterium]
MYVALIATSVIVLLCIFLSKAFSRIGVPSLLVFLVLGMLMGSEGLATLVDGIEGIYFHNYDVAEMVASFALIFIMFYGGLATNWSTAKPVALRAGLMSSLGTVITAFIIGGFCALVMGVPFLYGLLFGSVVSSTDAASVFSILRSRKLNLKNNLAPLLEIESGSNDPFSYMMMVITIAAITASESGGSISHALFGAIALQIFAAIGVAALISAFAMLIFSRSRFENTGFYPIFLTAVVLLGFATCSYVGGNGYLCVYITGIVVGNRNFANKVNTVHFFDSISHLMQILLFFMLGLLSFPSKLPGILGYGIILSLLLIIIARPVAVAAILSWFKTHPKQQLFVSWVGFRGAASIAFAIMAIHALGDKIPYDLFHLVFFLAMFSVMVQGTLMPVAAKKLNLIDESDENSVMKTFTDYFEEVHTHLKVHRIKPDDKLADKSVADSAIPENLLIVMIKRGDEVIFPKGTTKILENDILMVSGEDFSFFDE